MLKQDIKNMEKMDDNTTTGLFKQISDIKYSESLFENVGNTPLVEISHLPFIRKINSKIRIFAKLEMFNFGGSVKDRPALMMIQRSEEDGVLTPGKILIEPTSGNTGIGITWIGRLKGYKVKIVMPESMSDERKKMLKSFGAELILTPGNEGTDGAVHRARELVKENEDYVLLDQFRNQANVESHFLTTGPEILQQTNGKIDYFVAGIGTSGTITGVSKFLKAINPITQVIAVEPLPSPEKRIPGLKNLAIEEVPAIFSDENIDYHVHVDSVDAIQVAKKLAEEGSLLVGPSSGAALAGLLDFAKQNEEKVSGKRFIAIFPDTGTRYLSQN